MTRTIRLIGRSALVALGLAAASQVHAASVTIDAGAACVGFSWNSTNSTLSCTVDTACTISGASTGTPGTPVTLSASCPTSTTITWGGGNCQGQTGSTCNALEATAVGNVTYTAQGNSSAQASKVVNWTNNTVAPTGCSLTASPTSGSVATNVTLTAACTSGTTPITLAWSGAAGTGSCPTSMSGLSTTCTINGVAATSTWTVNFSNSAGNNNKSATFTYSTGGGGNFANCPGGAETITYSYGPGTPGDFVDTQNFGTNIVSIRFVIPTGTTVSTNKNIGWVEFIDPPTTREMAISTVACDFSAANAAKNSAGVAAVTGGSTQPSFNYRTSPSFSAFGLTPGVPYYVNIRNRDTGGNNSCTSGGTCNGRLTIRE